MPKGDAQKKADYFTKLHSLIDDYEKIFVVEADNVGSNQMHKIRMSLRGKAVVLMGKNTMMRKAIRAKLNSHPELEKLLPYVAGNMGFVFTNGDLRQVREALLSIRTIAPAKPGSLAPSDVFVEAQNTGMGPEKTSFFQALGIATKIVKGTIEIMNQVHLIKKGDKVGPSEAALLNMLNVSPFTFGLNVRAIYEKGFSVFENEILDITDDELLKSLTKAVTRVSCLSLAMRIPTVAAVPHLVLNAFKETLAISVDTDYTFSYSEKLKEYLADPSKFAVAAAPVTAEAAPAAAAEKKEEKKVEKEESEDEDMGFGLFD